MKRIPLIVTLLLLAGTTAQAQQNPASAHRPAHNPVGRRLRHSRPAPASQETARASLDSRDAPFPDVPKDHWAFQSVETLRRAGILRGYPAPASK